MRFQPARSALAIFAGAFLISCSEMPIAPVAQTEIKPQPTLDVSTPPVVRISQIYGAGGNSGATYNADYIELFNAGTVAVNLTGWSVQYAATTGTSWQATNLSGTIQPGKYFLVRESTGANGIAPPTPDVTGTIAMAAGAGKVALLNSTTLITSGTACPNTAATIDLVPYGAGTNCPNPTGTISTTNSAIRKLSGCTWTLNANSDFDVAAASPRNSSSAGATCGAPTTVTVSPNPVTIFTTFTQQFTAAGVDASGPVGASYTWSSSNNAVATVNPGTGLATAVAPGDATIKATASNGVFGTAVMHVVNPPPVASVVVTPSTTSVTQGGSQTFSAVGKAADNSDTPTTFTWSSSDNAIATVNASGVATSVAAGTVTIKATAANGVFGTASLTVNPVQPAGDVVISQVYGGGGNAGATYKNDYVELFNRTDHAIDLGGWSVQYNSSAGTGTWQVTPLSGTIAPHGYFLVQEAQGGGGTVVLVPDASGTIAMAAGAGKVALRQFSTAFSGACPSGSDLSDLVTYGATNCPNPAPTLTNTTADFRNRDGCFNTNNNTTDFASLSPVPRNSSSPLKNCTQPPRPQSAATLVINELMGDPVNAESASWGEWFEVYNYGAADLDLNGWTIITDGSSQPEHVINAHVIVPAGGYAVLGRGGDVNRNGGVDLDYNYFTGGTSTIWLDDADFLMLVDNANARVDSVAWTSLPAGITRGLRNASLAHADVNGSNWGFATLNFGAGDYGTPGANNEPLSDIAPIVSTNKITFSGRTASDQALPVGFEAQLFASETDIDGHSIATKFWWKSLTPSVASADSATGVIAALAAGTAIFRATAEDGTARTLTLPMATPVASATAQYGNNTEFGDPTDADDSNDFIIRRAQYTTSYNGALGIPNWVAYDLNGTHIQAGQDRCNCFTFDPELEAAGFTKYTTADYTGVKDSAHYSIDRGHMTRSFDRTTGTLDNARTFYFSNVVPQASNINQGPWAVLENYLGDYAQNQNKEVYIYVGPAGAKGTVKNQGKITIPRYTWKAALVLPRGKGLADVHDYRDLGEIVAVIMPNDSQINNVSTRNMDWHDFVVSVDSIEKLTGYQLFTALPQGIRVVVEGLTQPPLANAGGPYASVEGALVQFDGSASSDPDGDGLTYSWDFGDGSMGAGLSPTHTYADNGSYTAKLVVTDAKGATSFAVSVSVVVSNATPVVHAGDDANIPQHEAFALNASFTDAGVQDGPWTVLVDWGDGSTGNAITGSHSYAAGGSYTVRVTVTDKDGASSHDEAVVTVNHVPVANAGGPYSGNEGSGISFSAAGSSDTDGDGLSYSWNFGDGTNGTGLSPQHAYQDNGTYVVTLRVTDGRDTTTTTVSALVVNVAPVLGVVSAPVDPQAVGVSVSVGVSVTDAGTADTHTGSINWGDGSSSTASVTESNGAGSVSGSHVYGTPGVYTVVVTATDDDGASTTSTFNYVVVYDAGAGFVTGGGWISSPTGACSLSAVCTNATGKATFGFEAKYLPGANTPSGSTQFQFQAGGLSFKSSSYEWLVVGGPKAQFKGAGAINGVSGYDFLLTANDGQVAGGGGVDRFRIKIVDHVTGAIVYDNQSGDSDTAGAATALGGGSIVIHK